MALSRRNEPEDGDELDSATLERRWREITRALGPLDVPAGPRDYRLDPEDAGHFEPPEPQLSPPSREKITIVLLAVVAITFFVILALLYPTGTIYWTLAASLSALIAFLSVIPKHRRRDSDDHGERV